MRAWGTNFVLAIVAIEKNVAVFAEYESTDDKRKEAPDLPRNIEILG